MNTAFVCVCVCVALIAGYSFGAQYVEIGHVDDPLFRDLGYECLSKEPAIGPMKINETKKVRGTCSVARCMPGGSVIHSSCLLSFIKLLEDQNCKEVEGDHDKPYPECCTTIQC